MGSQSLIGNSRRMGAQLAAREMNGCAGRSSQRAGGSVFLASTPGRGCKGLVG